jgi:hypothetical protein
MLVKIISSFIIPFVVGPIVKAIVTYGMGNWINWMDWRKEKKKGYNPCSRRKRRKK